MSSIRSPRAERLYYENLLYLGAWFLLSGLQAQMAWTSQVGTGEKSGEKAAAAAAVAAAKSPGKPKEIPSRFV